MLALGSHDDLRPSGPATRLPDNTTVAYALSDAVARLRMAGVETPRLDARVLLEHYLGVTRARLYCDAERRLAAEDLAEYESLIARRERREPLAYIVGKREFFGLEFAVDRRVLVPRPETEILVEEAVRLLGDGPAVVADVGTGSGAIAVSLACSLPPIRVYAADVSAAALEVAAENCRRHGVADRVTLLVGDLLLPLPESIDLVVANLPYVSNEEMGGLPPEVGFEPELALSGGRDGLDMHRRLLAQAPTALRAGGAVLFEIGAAQGPSAVALARQAFPSARVRLARDLAGLDRVVVVDTVIDG